jgi:hypothetical protein
MAHEILLHFCLTDRPSAATRDGSARMSPFRPQVATQDLASNEWPFYKHGRNLFAKISRHGPSGPAVINASSLESAFEIIY